MFCHACGSPIGANQPFCSACGTSVGVPPVRYSRVSQHIRILAFLWIGFGALCLLPALGFLGFWPFLHRFVWDIPLPFVHLIHFVMGLAIVIGMAGIAAGWGLIEHQSWARPLALVLGILSLFKVPVGTALGIYTLWVLMPRESEEEYRYLTCR